MSNQEKTTKRPKKRGVFVRMKESTIDWVKSETHEDAPTVPARIAEIVEEKRKMSQKPPTGK